MLIFIIISILVISGYLMIIKKRPLYISIVGPMSGRDCSDGQAMVQGALICKNQIQKIRGMDRFDIQLKIFDDQNDPEKAKVIAQQIARDKNILIVLGHFSSRSSFEAGKIYQQMNIPAITASSMSDALINSNDWYFRVIPGASIQALFVSNFIKNELKTETVELIITDDHYGAVMAEAFSKAAQKLNLTQHKRLLTSESFDENLEKLLIEFQSSDAHRVLFVATQSGVGAEIISQLKYPGANFSIIGGPFLAKPSFMNHLKQYSFQENATPGYHSDGIYTVSPFLIEIGNDQSQLFREQFQSEFDEDPSWISYAYYDAMKTAITAIIHSDMNNYQQVNQKRNAIRNYLAGISTDEMAIQGITGHICFDKKGDMIKPYYLGVYQDQKMISAFSQFQTIPQKTDVNDILDQVLEKKLIKVNNRYMRKTKVIYTGIDINEIKDLNLADRTFKADFYIWFRYKGSFDQATHIEFENSVNKLTISASEKKFSRVLYKKKNDITIQAFRMSGIFKGNFNFRAFPFDTHKLTIHFRHSTLSRDKIIYIPDLSGMDTFEDIKTDIKKRSYALDGWDITNVIYYQDSFINESTLGDPDAFKLKNQIVYSKFNTEIHIMRKIVNYLIKNLFLILVLIIISYITYFIPSDQFSIRISIGMSTLLTSAFSHIKLTNSLPVAYLVALEYAFFGVYAISTLSIIISVMVYKNYKLIDNNSADSIIVDQAKIRLKKLTTIGLIFHPLIVFISSILIPSIYILNPNDMKNVNMTFVACFILMIIFCALFFKLKVVQQKKSGHTKVKQTVIDDGI